jgi:hypothetical protein
MLAIAASLLVVEAARAETDPNAALLAAIQSRAALVPAAERAHADAKLESMCRKIDDAAAECGETCVGSKLALDYKIAPEDLIRERAVLGCGWGDLIVARTLIANSADPPTHAELFAIHDRGTGWGQIAAGMGFRLGDVLRAVKHEMRVARGATPAGGKVAGIRMAAASSRDSTARR